MARVCFQASAHRARRHRPNTQRSLSCSRTFLGYVPGSSLESVQIYRLPQIPGLSRLFLCLLKCYRPRSPHLGCAPAGRCLQGISVTKPDDSGYKRQPWLSDLISGIQKARRLASNHAPGFKPTDLSFRLKVRANLMFLTLPESLPRVTYQAVARAVTVDIFYGPPSNARQNGLDPRDSNQQPTFAETPRV